MNNEALARLSESRSLLDKSLKERIRENDAESARIREKDEQLRQAMRLSGIGFFKWNALTGNCEFCSEQHAEHFGLTPGEYQRITGGRKPYTQFVHKEDRLTFLEAVARIDRGEAIPFDYRVIRPNGEVRHIRQINEPIFENGVEVSVIGASIDFTELYQSQEQLRHAQKAEAIGNLTGGIAHDFNNLLAVMLGNLELSQMHDTPSEKDQFVSEAIRATERGSDLVRSLLSFAGKARLSPIMLNINQIMENTAIWSSRILPENIEIEKSLCDDLWDTKLDAAAVEVAIINLLLNARDAMPYGGKITVKTRNIVVCRELLNVRSCGIDDGAYVELTVTDTGVGINKDKAERIFDPFFTEKPVGHGTGLGLSMVKGFIEQSKGAIEVSSEPGLGTTFKLYFPAEMRNRSKQAKVVERFEVKRRRILTILLVEDDLEVAKALERILIVEGHHVTHALSGDHAWNVYQKIRRTDLLLSDIVMPGKLQGPDLAKLIKSADPKTPCIFLSGYDTEIVSQRKAARELGTYLMKPVSRELLLSHIDRICSDKKIDAREIAS